MTIIDPRGDLTVKVTEYDGQVKGKDGKHPVKQIGEFLVKRQVLIQSSMVFRRMLGPGKFAEADKSIVELQEDRVKTMEIWFLILHGFLQGTSYTPTRGDNRTTGYNVEIEEMWHLVAACDKYNLDVSLLKNWFGVWYGRQEISKIEPKMLLFPCWRFDHAAGFAACTKTMVYNNIWYIEEGNPTNYIDLHIPARIMQQLNAARGRLRVILLNDLFKPNDKLLTTHCSCKEKTLYNYEKTLYDLNVWPLERATRSCSMEKILERLDGFVYMPHQEACSTCRRIGIADGVRSAKDRTRNYFEGMCLDCMDKSQPKMGADVNMDYWDHHKRKEHELVVPLRAGVKPCRVQHRMPTWYHSFMGRQRDRDRFKKRREAERDSWSDYSD